MILLILPAVYAEEEYTLGVEDVLRISVLEQPELNSTVTVAPDGTIVLPQPIGAIPAKGLTRAQLEEAIRQKLSPHISGGVNVTVQMIEYKSRKIAIFGEVRSPGIYTYVQIPPLPEILARAGGLTPTADLMRIMVLSPDHQKPTQIINLQQLLQQTQPAWPQLLPGDTVFVSPQHLLVPEEQAPPPATETPNDLELPAPTASAPVQGMTPSQIFITVLGEVSRPATYQVAPGATVLDVLNLAGGPTLFADLQRVTLIRQNMQMLIDIKKVLQSGKLQWLPPLQTGDTIRVPRLNQKSGNWKSHLRLALDVAAIVSVYLLVSRVAGD